MAGQPITRAREEEKRRKEAEKNAWRPNPGAQEFVLSIPGNIREILYGGARGGGKTDAGMVWLADPKYLQNKKFRGLVLRRNADDLSDWLSRARAMYAGLGATFVGKPTEIVFPSGATIRTGHLKDENAFEKYQGHEYQKILVEELTLIKSEKLFNKLMNSLRTSDKSLQPQFFGTTNPGGPGHGWVKRRWIDPGTGWKPDPMKPWSTRKGTTRIYIPATIDDNPKLMEADPAYINTINELEETDPELYRAWRYGDWNVFIGQVFTEWRESKHIIQGIPDITNMRKLVCFDWGYNAPACALWLAIDSYMDDEGKSHIRHIYMYRELYITKRTSRQWAKAMRAYYDIEPFDFMVLPHDCFSIRHDGNTIANDIESEGTPVARGESGTRQARLNRVNVIHRFLQSTCTCKGSKFCPGNRPILQVLNTCKNFTRTITDLPYDESDPELYDTDAEDHAIDAAGLGLITIHDPTSYVISPTSEPIRFRQALKMNTAGTHIEGLTIDPSLEAILNHRNNNEEMSWMAN